MGAGSASGLTAAFFTALVSHSAVFLELWLCPWYAEGMPIWPCDCTWRLWRRPWGRPWGLTNHWRQWYMSNIGLKTRCLQFWQHPGMLTNHCRHSYMSNSGVSVPFLQLWRRPWGLTNHWRQWYWGEAECITFVVKALLLSPWSCVAFPFWHLPARVTTTILVKFFEN